MAQHVRYVPEARLADLRSLSVFLGVPVGTLRQLVATGNLPVVRLPGVRRVLVDTEDLPAVLARWKGTAV